MKKLFCFSILYLFSACASSHNIKYFEGISGNNLTVFSKIDLYLIPEDEGDDSFEIRIIEILKKRAIFLLAAHGEKKLTSSKDLSKYAVLLNENQINPEILYKEYKEDFLYVWARYDITPFMEILNDSDKR